MRPLNMTLYRPYRAMGRSCLTRPIQDKQVIWVRPEARTTPDGQFVVRPLQSAEIAGRGGIVASRLSRSLRHGSRIYPVPGSIYSSRFILADSWEQDRRAKKCCMLVVEEVTTGRLVAATMMTKFDKNLAD